MAVGKPDFDLNSFGVKYLSKDQVQDFLDKALGKNSGDTPDPVEEKRDKDGNIIQVKPHPQKPEVFTDIKGGNPHQNPTPIDGGGFPGKQRRTGKKDADGNPIKYTQSQDGTKPKEGNVPTSRKNDVQYGKLGEESTSEVRESFDMITNSPEWQEEINRDAALTTEEGTEKFDDTPANRALKDKIRARAHKKKLADEKKKKKNKKKANDIIMDMNILKLDLMKDINTRTSRNVPKEEKQTFQEQSTAERIGYKPFEKPDLATTPKGGKASDKIGETSTYGDGSDTDKILNPEWTPRDGYVNHPSGKSPADLKRKSAETIFKAISLKLDLMKDGIEGGGKNVPSDVDDKYGEFYQHKEGQAEKVRSNNPFYSFSEGDSRVQGKRPIKGDKPKVDPRIRERDWTSEERREAESHAHPHAGDQDATEDAIYGVDRQYTGNRAPSDLKEKAEETIYKAISLKLDLMKYDKNEDILSPAHRPKEGKISYETPCFNCGRPYEKGESEKKHIHEHLSREMRRREQREESGDDRYDY